MITCHHCGRENAADHRFCGACGARIPGVERDGVTITAPECDRPAWVADPVTGLRVRNTFREFELKPWQRQTSIGRAPTCDITLDVPALSSVHCMIERANGGGCVVHDHGSKNGILTGDGSHRRIFDLTPGTVFMAATVPLVAFSASMQALRKNLQRYLGYTDERHQRGVEDALEAVGQRRHVLMAAPPGGQPAGLARLIHEAGPGARQPFRVADQIPSTAAGQERMFKAAENGSLVLAVDQLPEATEHLRGYLRRPPYNVRIISIGADPAQAVGAHLFAGETTRPISLRIPSLAERPQADRLELISVLSAEIGQRIGYAEIDLAAHVPGILSHPWPENLDELEATIERLLVLHREGGKHRKAAKALGVPRGQWRGWYERFARDVGNE